MDEISLPQFQEALAKYSSVIKSISDTKGGKFSIGAGSPSSCRLVMPAGRLRWHETAKPGQKTLETLDKHRYAQAPRDFGPEKPAKSMDLEDVKVLVEWKL